MESLELLSPRTFSGDFEIKRTFKEPVQVEYWRVRERASFVIDGRGYLCRRAGLDRRSPRGRSAAGELPSDLPDPLRILVMFLAVVAWRRIAGSVFQAITPGG